MFEDKGSSPHQEEDVQKNLGLRCSKKQTSVRDEQGGRKTNNARERHEQKIDKKSVLGSLPIYNMSLFKVPMGVLKTLEQLRSRFFRGVDHGGNKMAWISWDKVCAFKEKGGLGVGSFYALNRALLFKWVWRFKSQPCAFWVTVVKAIHGSGDHIRSPRAFVWRDILRSGVDLVNKGIDLKHFCNKLIGDGVNTRFWKEVWLGNYMLHTAFPRLFALEEVKDVSVAAKFIQPWNASFRRPMLGGAEEAQGQELSALLDTVQLNQLPDKWVWDLSSDGSFSVASARHYVDDTLLGGSSSATRWVSMVPIKVNVFAWKMMCDALPTRWNLSQRGLELNSLLCPICGEKVEDMEHLFFTCSFASEITDKVVRCWGLSTFSFPSLQGWKGWLDGVRLRKKLKEVLEGVFFVTWWSIWKFRNKLLFDSVLPRKSLIYDDIVSSSYMWCSNRSDKRVDWRIWLQNPSFCYV
ncbi:hypothetical protein LXL04_018161 [Taraxacum kok-saghyz]